MSKIVKHKKTGLSYEIISDNFMFKDFVFFNEENEPVYEWRKGLILYKALYDNPDGPYFTRTREDFISNFEEVIEDFDINKFYSYDEGEQFISKEEWDIMSKNLVDFYDNVFFTDPRFSKKIFLITQKINTKLFGVDQKHMIDIWVNNYENTKSEGII